VLFLSVQRVVNVAYIWYKMVRKNSVQNSETELKLKSKPITLHSPAIQFNNWKILSQKQDKLGYDKDKNIPYL